MRIRRRKKSKANVIIIVLIISVLVSLLMSGAYAFLSERFIFSGNVILKINPKSPQETIVEVLGSPSASNASGLRGSPDNLYFANESTNYFRLTGDPVIWRIVSIDSVGLRIMRDPDSSLTSVWGPNNSTWDNSTVLATLRSWYNTNLSHQAIYIVQNPPFLVGATAANKPENLQGSSYSSAPIGLINTLEYTNAGANKSWMAGNANHWLSTRVTGRQEAFFVNSNNAQMRTTTISTSMALRPVIVLKAGRKLLGTGTTSDPFRME